MPDDERSRSGAPIFRHTARGPRDFVAARTDESTAAAIVSHLTSFYGGTSTVFHELISDRVHIDVHIVPPTADTQAWTLFTTGMSDRPMTTPRNVDTALYAEVLVRLPATWRVDEPSFRDERWYWPVRWLKQLARLPHDYETWLGTGHTVPNGDPPQPFDAHTRACCMLAMPPMSLPHDAWFIEPVRNKRVQLLALYPIDRGEMQLKLDRGLDALVDLFEGAGVGDVFDPERASVAPRKKRFFFF